MARKVRKTFYKTNIRFHTEDGENDILTVNAKVDTIAEAIYQLSKQGVVNAIVDCITVNPVVYVMDNDTFRDYATDIINKKPYSIN